MERTRYDDLKNQTIQERIARALERIATALENLEPVPELDDPRIKAALKKANVFMRKFLVKEGTGD